MNGRIFRPGRERTCCAVERWSNEITMHLENSGWDSDKRRDVE